MIEIDTSAKRAKEIVTKLHEAYDSPVTELDNWENPIQFMASVILSAQATDKGVNKITPALFAKYKTSEDFANADLEEITKMVSSINYYRTKAKRIIDANKFVIANYNGELPPDMEKLIAIPGIGRKSANVIMQEALKVDAVGMVVDTHITRLSYRLGLQPYDNQKDAVKIEQKLMEVFDKDEWRFLSQAMVLHGRYVCKAKKPICSECVLNKVCPSAFKIEGAV
jgi:endonuclease-3